LANIIFNGVLYAVALGFLIFSFVKDKKKTKLALLKAWNSFKNILPLLLGIVLIIGMVLAVLDPKLIIRFIGKDSGFMGTAILAIFGAITMIPGFIAFPTAALVLEGGGGYMQIAAFISTLMMVGVLTAPMEIKFFGRKVTILRNVIAFAFSFLVAFIIGKVLG
jgi:uncharacterized membrane protein YraQ (UPF0718 family)